MAGVLTIYQVYAWLWTVVRMMDRVYMCLYCEVIEKAALVTISDYVNQTEPQRAEIQ